MYFRIAAEIILAVFAVIGLYASVNFFVQKFFSDKRIFLTVEILDNDDARDAEALIREALGSFLAIASARIAVMISAELADNDRLMETVEKYGVECYIIEVD